MIWEELAAAAVVGGVVGWFARSRLGRRRDPERAVAPPSDLRPAPPAPGPAAGVAVASPPTAVAPAPASSTVLVPSRPTPALGPPTRLSEGADTAGRVIVHLATLGRLRNDEIGRVGYTQQGIGDALRLRQGTVAKVLQRLEAADVVEVDRRHVSGEPRRLKVYRLTALGESVARDLRHRRPPAAPGNPGATP